MHWHRFRITCRGSSSITSIIGVRPRTFQIPYAQRFPRLVFLRLMGMPVGKAAEFIEERGIKLSADWTSLLVTAVTEEGSSALNRREVLNICYMLFLAGLDTVTNAHAHIWRYLAEHAEVQEDLRRNVARIPLAIEELLRLFAITNSSRRDEAAGRSGKMCGTRAL
jgi:Cytochrome P450